MNTLLAIAFPILALATMFAAVWFVETRLIATFGIKRTALFRTVIFGFFIAVNVSLSFFDKSSNSVLGAFYVIGGVSFMFLVYLTFSFILVKVVEFVWKVPAFWSGVTVLALTSLVISYGILAARTFQVNEVEIKISGLEKPVTIMHMPDIHIGHHRGRAYLKKIVDETNVRSPDIVAINGDLLDAATALEPGVLEPLSEFKAPAYYTGGNHENYVDAKRVQEIVAEHGVRVLRNEVVDINGIQLVGLNYMKPDDETFDLHPSEGTESIKSVVPTLSLKDNAPKILLHHSPVGAQYVEARGIDLMLSGHTHGGQVFPQTILGSLIYKFNRGLYKLGNLQIFVSQGAGTFLVPLRIGSSNEINLIKLVP